MASATDSAFKDNAPAEQPSTTPRPMPQGHVWPMLVILALFWAFEFSVYSIEMAAFTRFISRWIVYLVVFLIFLTWWMTYRGFRLRDRFLAVGAMLALSFLAGLVSHKSVQGMPLVMLGTLYCITSWTLWVAISRPWSQNVRRLGLFAVMAVTFGYFPLIRWEGLFGTQRMEMRWRWQPSAEEEFLASKSKDEGSGTGSDDAESTAQPWTLQAGDWPEFRGVGRRGVVEGIKFDAANWSTSPPAEIWRHRVGPAWSTVIVVDGHLVTQEQRGENEAVVCYNAETGEEQWAHQDPIRFEEGLSGPGPRSTPTFDARDGGRIYTLGAKGLLNCLEASTGKAVWSQDIVAESQATIPQWGYSVTPLVVGDLVIVYAGGEKNKSLLAYAADTGKLAWAKPAGSQSYSSPQLVTLLGQQQVLVQDNKALWSFRPEDGELLWKLDGTSEVSLPQLQPHVLSDGQLVVASEPGVALVNLSRDGDQWKADRQWDTKALKPAFNHFVVHDGYVYGLDDGILVCAALETGTRQWKKGRYGHGQLMLVRDQNALLIVGEKGEVALVAANPKKLEELGRFQALEGKTWNHPIVVNGRLYVRNAEEMACYQIASPSAEVTH
jgi:outer membrane protein assembly factor BamB